MPRDIQEHLVFTDISPDKRKKEEERRNTELEKKTKGTRLITYKSCQSKTVCDTKCDLIHSIFLFLKRVFNYYYYYFYFYY